MDEEQVSPRAAEPRQVHQEEEEEEEAPAEVAGEQRAQALRELTLTRKKKQRPAERTGAARSRVPCDL